MEKCDKFADLNEDSEGSPASLYTLWLHDRKTNSTSDTNTESTNFFLTNTLLLSMYEQYSGNTNTFA